MLFKFRNIGKIAEADIEINGLTVLGGHNDTGKSTIGKTLYAIIKTIKNSAIHSHNDKRNKVFKMIQDLDINVRKLAGIPFSSFISYGDLIDIIKTSLNEKEIIKHIVVGLEKIKTVIEEKDEISNQTIIPDLDKVFNEVIDKISNLLNYPYTDIDNYKSAFNSTHKLLFGGEFINKNNLKISAEIICNNYEKNVMKIVVDADSVKDFFLIDAPIFQDVTLIDSPTILNQYNFVKFKGMIIGDMFFSNYHIDLETKTNYAKSELYYTINDSQKEIVHYINNVIDGRLYYEEEREDFIFERDQNIRVKSINTASGIKAFGIIQLLIISGAINPNTLLIIDEPEVHLHPEWQLKYAKLITLLVDSGIYVLISSHSPYMIEALKVYSDKLKLDKITRFYVGNAHEKGTIFQDVTEDLEPLFHQLAFPMQKLTFEA